MQGELEAALSRLAGEPVRANLAGRTDTGVHAWGQVASLMFPARPRLDTPGAVMQALNGILPADMAVLDADEVDEAFHARFSAKQRAYRYLIWNAPEPLPLLRRYSLHVRRRIDREAMGSAATLLVGTHDLAAFAGQGLGMPHEGERKPNTVRTVYAASLKTVDEQSNYWAWQSTSEELGAFTGRNLLALDLIANAFLPQMIRTVVGTLLEVGEGKRTVEEFKGVIDSCDRRQSGPTAKPQGLCLLWVSY